MNIRPFPQFDFSAGIQAATSWILKKPNELRNGFNVIFSEEIGAFQRRLGFERVGSAFATNKTPRGGHTARFSTGSIRMVACNNAGDTFTLVRYQDPGTGNWTDLITDIPADSEVFFFDYMDEVYVTGYVRSSLAPITPRNIDKTLDVSLTRNILNMPPCHYIVEWNGALYACNVTVGAIRYPDRAYESSPPLGVITYVQNDTSGLINTLVTDSARYLKVGMPIDIYRAGTDTKLYDITITAVDKVLNTITFTPFTLSFLPAAVDTTLNRITLSSTATYPTGTPIRFTNSGGGLPGGISAGVTYYVEQISGTQIKIYNALGDIGVNPSVDITTQGTGTHTSLLYYVLADNDELWMDGRKNKLTMLWNTDYPTPEQAEYLFMPSGVGASTAITAVIKSNNRLFLFTRSSRAKFDGQNLIATGNIGCISMRTLQNVEDDWMLWLDANGNVYARNDSTGQQEKISRAIRKTIMRRVTQTNLAAANAGVIDSVYKLYLGDIDNEHIRVDYDFDSNTWAIEKLGYPAMCQITDESTGYIKPYFMSTNGRLYIDETGNLDDDKVIPMMAELGKSMFDTEKLKTAHGVSIFSEGAAGLKVYMAVGKSDFVSVGQIGDDELTFIQVPRSGQEKLKQGVSINTRIAGSIQGDPPSVQGIVTHWIPREDTPSVRR